MSRVFILKYIKYQKEPYCKIFKQWDLFVNNCEIEWNNNPILKGLSVIKEVVTSFQWTTEK